jgi:hypothetical protein
MNNDRYDRGFEKLKEIDGEAHKQSVRKKSF